MKMLVIAVTATVLLSCADEGDYEVPVEPGSTDSSQNERRPAAEDQQEPSLDEPQTEETQFDAQAHEPLFMDAQTPAELLGQVKANIECISGPGPLETRELCAHVLTGYDGRFSEITEHYVSLARWSDSQRNRDPNWEYDFDIEIIDSTIPENETFNTRDAGTELIVRYTDDYDSPEYLRYSFVRIPVRTITEGFTIEQEVSEREVWAFRRSTIVEPGTRYEIG